MTWMGTRADLLRWLRSDPPPTAEDFARHGLMIGPVAAQLRNLGYEVEIVGEGNERVLEITANPGIGARKRMSNWLALGDDHA